MVLLVNWQPHSRLMTTRAACLMWMEQWTTLTNCQPGSFGYSPNDSSTGVHAMHLAGVWTHPKAEFPLGLA